MPAPRPRHPKPKNAYSPRHARASVLFPQGRRGWPGSRNSGKCRPASQKHDVFRQLCGGNSRWELPLATFGAIPNYSPQLPMGHRELRRIIGNCRRPDLVIRFCRESVNRPAQYTTVRVDNKNIMFSGKIDTPDYRTTRRPAVPRHAALSVCLSLHQFASVRNSLHQLSELFVEDAIMCKRS
eukprot:gene20433-biopygen8554